MEHRQWLMKELETWVDSGLVTAETARELRGRYRRDAFRVPVKTPLFFAAGFGILIGIFLLGASLWNHLSQDSRFFLAMAPALVTLAAAAGFIAWEKKAVSPMTRAIRNRKSDIEESLFPEMEEEEEKETARTVSHTIRETVCTLHGLAAVLSLWLVRDTYRLDTDVFMWSAAFAAVLLLMAYITKSAGLGIVSVGLCCLTAWNGAHEGWPVLAAWTLMALALPHLFFLILSEREDPATIYAWGWTAGALLLAYITGIAVMWQVLFFTTAASLTWLFGAGMKRGSRVGELFRFLGSISVALALLGDLYTGTWRNPDGNIFLWVLFGGFLIANGYLLRTALRKKEWLACFSGLSPYAAALAALVALWEGSGVASAMLMTLYALTLGVFLLISGFHTGRRRQIILGVLILGSGALIRLVDSTLSLAQRGIYFLFLGLAAALFCYAVSAAGKKAVARHGYGREEDDHE